MWHCDRFDHVLANFLLSNIWESCSKELISCKFVIVQMSLSLRFHPCSRYSRLIFLRYVTVKVFIVPKQWTDAYWTAFLWLVGASHSKHLPRSKIEQTSWKNKREKALFACWKPEETRLAAQQFLRLPVRLKFFPSLFIVIWQTEFSHTAEKWVQTEQPVWRANNDPQMNEWTKNHI